MEAGGSHKTLVITGYRVSHPRTPLNKDVRRYVQTKAENVPSTMPWGATKVWRRTRNYIQVSGRLHHGRAQCTHWLGIWAGT